MNNKRRQLIVAVVGCCVALVGMSLRLMVLDHRSHTPIWWLTTFGDPAQRGWNALQPRIAVLSHVAMALFYSGLLLTVAAVLAWLLLPQNYEKDAA